MGMHAGIRWSWRLGLYTLTATSIVAAGYTWLALQEIRRRLDESIVDLSLPEEIEPLVSLHARLGVPQPGDWLHRHYELGQTYTEYVGGWPQKPDQDRKVIYVQPLGDLDADQRRIMHIAVEFLGVYFDMPVRLCEDVPLDKVPEEARRLRSDGRTEQILTQWVDCDVLAPRLPNDAFLYLAFTASDLWPGRRADFAFGQSWPDPRTAVCSFVRHGGPDQGEVSFSLYLLRMLKTTAHKTGHNMSMARCIYYECVMGGASHLAEADRHPLELCPQCLAKLCYATGADPARRFERLIKFYKAHGLKAEQEFCERSLAVLRKE